MTAGEVSLDPRVLRLWRIRAGLTVGLVAAGLGIVTGLGVDPLPGVAVAVAVMVVAAVPTWAVTRAAYRAWRFEVAPDALHLRHGVVVRVESTIPYHRVQHIDIAVGPLERMLGLASLVLRTAAATSDAAVPGVPAADADDLRRHILARVGAGDAV